MSRVDLRLAGNGGQGIILATVMLAEGAVISGKYTAQNQSYGPEARGGSCKAETIISDTPIGFTKIEKPSFLMALTKNALDKYCNVSEDCIVMLDSSLQVPESMAKNTVYSLPIIETAKKKVGKVQTANVIAVGCISTLLGLFDNKTLQEAVERHIPKGTEELNMKALNEGVKLAKEALKEKK